MKLRFVIGLLLLLLGFTSCNSSKRAMTNKTSQKEHFKKNPKIDQLISYAKLYQGTRYKYGGTTKKGMDCSGLVFTAFQKVATPIQRTSREMAKQGKPVTLKNAQPGDLLFFKTSKNKRNINHVGLVIDRKNNTPVFIHATTSKGVIISTLSESYWNRSFALAKRYF